MAFNTLGYLPSFIWKFWLSQTGSNNLPRDSRVHMYNVYDNELSEFVTPPAQIRTVFQDFRDSSLAISLADTAERTFYFLEGEAERILTQLMERTYSSGIPTRTTSFCFDKKGLATLKQYLAFLRFRNSKTYAEILVSLNEPIQSSADGRIFSAYLPAINEHRARIILRTIIEFLQHRPLEHRSSQKAADTGSPPIAGTYLYELRTIMNNYCWRLCDAEVCIGVASEGQEFILSDACFGALSEGFKEDPECTDIFFPIFPTFVVYILGNMDQDGPFHLAGTTKSPFSKVEVGIECAVDVHLRNVMILQTYPQHLYFSSLRPLSLSISSYDEFRWIQEHQDYSRLKQRCRQKFLQETVTKTLVVKGSVILTDLTDEIVQIGSSAVSNGAFSDVWKAVWNDPVEKRPRIVALKILRQIVVKNVREKLMKRLQAEVVAWHKLCHRNISQLFGILQFQNSVGMVSSWCENGTICQYLKGNMTADRLDLLVQIASGIEYLHSAEPVVVHGDLKGANILIDERGRPVIIDFGLSKVFEDVSQSLNICSSFFAGSTRWMAPELILALVQDDTGQPPPITTSSDVYAFASVCLEVATGEIPYPNRTNDHAVTVDILRGVKPSRGSCCYVLLKDEDAFWALLDRCWNQEFHLRPAMFEIVRLLEGMIP